MTRYGLVTSYSIGTIDELPTRGEYEVKEGDILFAINTSSRGTVARIPKELEDGAICTSGFLVIVPSSKEEGHLLWYSLRSEFCRKQVFYLAQTASQPELKSWLENEFVVPLPVGSARMEALEHSTCLSGAPFGLAGCRG